MMDSSTSSKPVKVIGLRMLDIARTTESSKKGPVLLRDLERFQDIRHDNWPVIIALTSQKIRKYYPLEKMYITPYQTISNNNEVFNQSEISLTPSERWEHIDEHIHRLHLFHNPWQNLFGIKIFPDNVGSLSNKWYDILKYLERKYEVVTQHLTIETVSRICEKKQMETLQNIINKTNKKLGGCNTRVRPLDEG
uniref:Piwi domain-containing protein n=1 Tax=Heterorhabditis bacteriophora TaxID=37862 RepID=A0A1I7WPL1_HETBA